MWNQTKHVTITCHGRIEPQKTTSIPDGVHLSFYAPQGHSLSIQDAEKHWNDMYHTPVMAFD